jgi:hypothetical protein
MAYGIRNIEITIITGTFCFKYRFLPRSPLHPHCTAAQLIVQCHRHWIRVEMRRRLPSLFAAHPLLLLLAALTAQRDHVGVRPKIRLRIVSLLLTAEDIRSTIAGDV